ncbi:hypothetical protein [Streptomyces sp. NPDC089799]|uniref:hypothetical protein n=1 Tax=Streptomyces sp. NPDC089799 TaxID=3155066 RepID=UPI003443CAA7
MSRFGAFRRLFGRGRGQEEREGYGPYEREQSEGERSEGEQSGQAEFEHADPGHPESDLPESGDRGDLERAVQQGRMAEMLHRREVLRAEAERIVDRRLDPVRDAAPWNTATFGTLTAASAASAAVLLTTGFTWWFLLPAGLGVVCLLLTVQAVRRLRGRTG